MKKQSATEIVRRKNTLTTLFLIIVLAIIATAINLAGDIWSFAVITSSATAACGVALALRLVKKYIYLSDLLIFSSLLVMIGSLLASSDYGMVDPRVFLRLILFVTLSVVIWGEKYFKLTLIIATFFSLS